MNFTELLGPIENSTPTHSRKAILWGSESLLVDSVELFLKAGAVWDVDKISPDCGVNYLIQQVKTVRPAVVVLCQDKEEIDTNILMELSQVHSCMKVVVISLESNLVQVYSRQHIIMRDVSDLLSVVDTGYFPNTQSSNEEAQATK